MFYFINTMSSLEASRPAPHTRQAPVSTMLNAHVFIVTHFSTKSNTSTGGLGQSVQHPLDDTDLQPHGLCCSSRGGCSHTKTA